MCGKGVAQRVRGDILFDARLLLVVLDYLPEALARHTLTADVDEQGLLVRHEYHLRTHKRDIIVQRLDCRRIHRDEPLLVSAVAADNARAEIHVSDVKIDKLSHSYARRVKQFKHGLVSEALRVYTFRLLKQELDLFAGQYLRKLLRTFIGNKPLRGIHGNDLLYKQMRIQALYRCNTSGHGRDRFSLGSQHCDVALKVLARGFCNVILRMTVQIFAKLADVPEVGTEGVCGCFLFFGKMLFKKLYAFRVLHSNALLSV